MRPLPIRFKVHRLIHVNRFAAGTKKARPRFCAQDLSRYWGLRGCRHYNGCK